MLRPVDVESALGPAREERSCRRNVPEISPQVHDLPRAQPHQHPHRPKRKPFDALIGALVRVPKLLLPRPEVVHLSDNLPDQLFDASQLRLDRLQLLLRLDGRPVSGVGADVNVQFNVAGWASSPWIMGLAHSPLRVGGSAYEMRSVGFQSIRRKRRRRAT